jgi:molecular chaperone DnaK
MLEEQKENVKDDEKSKLEGYISEMKEAVKDKNVAKINELEASINSVWNDISQRIYANQGHQQQTTAQQPTDEEAAEQPNDVQDAEFEEVK